MSKRYVPVALIAFLLGGAAATSILLPRGDLETASLRGEASNSGVRLGADRGVVHVFRAGEARYLVAEGSLDEPMDVPPGRYDVRVTLSNSADHQSRWIRDVTAAAGRVTTVGASFATGELSIEAKVGAAE